MASLLKHDDSRGISQIIVTVVFSALAATAIILRLASRRMKKTSLQFNDYAILVSLFFLLGFATILFTANVLGGAGKHETEVPLENILNLLKIFTAAEPVWAITNTFVKLSILDLYCKIFRGSGKVFSYTCFSMMGITTCYLLMVILETFLLCRPFAFNWDKSIGDGYCANTQAAFLSAGIINLLIDLIVVLLPLGPLWDLKMATSKKIQLTAIFCLGGFICIISILRIISINKLGQIDFTYRVSLVGIWSFLEPSLGIVSACLPVMRPILAKLPIGGLTSWTKSFRSKPSTGKRHMWGDGGFSASTERIDAGSKRFQRLEDLTLTSIEMGNTGGKSYSNNIGPASQVSSKHGDVPVDEANIQVKHDWTVHVNNV